VRLCGKKSKIRCHLAPHDHTIQGKKTRAKPAETTTGGETMARAEMKTTGGDRDPPETATTAVDETEADHATDLIEIETEIVNETETEAKTGEMVTLEEIEMVVGIETENPKVIAPCLVKV
jgi:hypothetical protein